MELNNLYKAAMGMLGDSKPVGWVSRTSSAPHIPFPCWVEPNNHWPRSNYISWYSPAIQSNASPFLIAFHHETKEICFALRSSAGLKDLHASLWLFCSKIICSLLKSESWAFMALTSSRAALWFGVLGLRSRRSQDGAEGSVAVWK